MTTPNRKYKIRAGCACITVLWRKKTPVAAGNNPCIAAVMCPSGTSATHPS